MHAGDLARRFEGSRQRDPRGDRTSRITWCVRDEDLDQQGKLIILETGYQRMGNGHGGGACVTVGTYCVVDEGCWPACGRTSHRGGGCGDVPIPC